MAPKDKGPDKMRMKLDYKNTITVLVGPKATSFIVHMATVCAKSSFFESATKSEWREAREKTIRLADTESGVFEAYVHWAYTSEVNLSFVEEGLVSLRDLSVTKWRGLTRLWVLADSILDHELCNRLADMTAKNLGMLYGGADQEAVTYTWKNTSPDSPLRKLEVDS